MKLGLTAAVLLIFTAFTSSFFCGQHSLIARCYSNSTQYTIMNYCIGASVCYIVLRFTSFALGQKLLAILSYFPRAVLNRGKINYTVARN